MAFENRDSVVFGDYELDMATRQLRHLGEPVALQPRVLELLAFLIRNHERAVDKDAIQDAVWSGTIVSETALTRAIMKARRAVGDSADRQSVIRTVHGHGYQFVASIEEPKSRRHDDTSAQERPSAPVVEEPHSGQVVPSPAKIRRMRWLLAAAIVAVAIAVTWVWQKPVDDSHLRVAILPVHNATDSEELDWVKLGLLGFANDLMRSSTQLAVVPASEMVRYAENSEWTPGSGLEKVPDHLTTLRRAFGASHIVFSQIESTVGGLRLSYTLFGKDGEINHSTMVGEQSTELIRGMVRQVNNALTSAKYLQGSALTSEGDPFISEAYARAVSYELKGQCRDALPLFKVVFDRDATNFVARLKWADCTRIQGRPDEAEEALLELVNDLKDTSDVVLKSRTLGQLGTVYHVTGRLDDAQTFLTEGLELARQSSDNNAIGKLLNAQALLSKDRGDTSTAKQLLALTAVAYREAGREILPGQVHSALANLSMGEGNWGEAETQLNNALTSFRTIGDRRNEAMMINNYGYLRRRQDRVEEAETFHLESLAIRKEIGDLVGQGRIMGMLSNIYTDQNRHKEAQDMAEQAVQIASEANDTLFMATGLAQLAAAETGLARTDLAREHYEQSLTLFEQIEDYSRMAQVELRLIQLDIDDEQLETAKSRVQRVLNMSLQREIHEVVIQAQELTGDIEMELNKAERAEHRYQEALAYIETHNFKSRRTAIRIKLGHLYLDSERLELAEPLLGFILADGDSANGMKFHARYAFYKGDATRAADIMTAAKALKENNWSDDDARTLERYLAKSTVTN